MNLLAIETSSTFCSIALLKNDEIYSVHEPASMQQAQTILSQIDHLLKKTNTKLNQLNAIAFGCGPGSFTGVRIATSVAQGLGYASNLPLIPISSLAALAQSTYEDLGWKKILTAVDARIQEVYWGIYQINTKGLAEAIGPELVCPPSEISLPPENEWYGVGDAWKIYASELPYKPTEVSAKRVPMATGILTLAKEKFINKQWINPEGAVPTYLRNNVAKKSHQNNQ